MVEVVVESPGVVVELLLDGELVLDVELLLVLDVELLLVLEVELVLLVDVLVEVVAVVEKVIALTAPVVRSFGSSATRIVQACWSSHAKSLLGPAPANVVNVSEPAPLAFESETTTVRKSQSLVGLVGAELHCSMMGLKFGFNPVQETVTFAPSVSPVFGLTVTDPTAPPT